MCLSCLSPRPSSTKTRIKTQIAGRDIQIRSPPRPSSTKTRIKTRPVWRNQQKLATPRPSSTKTRIKTRRGAQTVRLERFRDHPPLKQGLRLSRCPLHLLYQRYIPRPSSTKTRIKTSSPLASKRAIFLLRDHPPLKQGLRQECWCVKHMKDSRLRDHPPLKQGLRFLSIRVTLKYSEHDTLLHTKTRASSLRNI